MRIELEIARAEIDRREAEVDGEAKRREREVREREEQLKEKERVITELMLAGGAKRDEGPRASLESTVGSMRGATQRGFDAFLGRFDQYKEELEKKE